MTSESATRVTLSEAMARLGTAQKPKAATPLYLRLVNRKIGGFLAAAGYVRGATPNQATVVSAAFSLAGVVLLAAVPPSWPVGAGIAAALLVGYAFDSADGQLARLRGGGSAAGEWLDHVVDACKTCLVHSGAAVSLYRFTDLPRWVLLLPLAYLTAAMTLQFATMLRDQLLRARPKGPAAPDSLMRSAVLLPVDYGVLAASFALLAAPTVFAVVYGALAAFHVAFTLRLAVRTHAILKSC